MFFCFCLSFFLFLETEWQPTQVFLFGKPMDKGTWQVTVHGVTKSQTQLSDHTPTTSLGPILQVWLVGLYKEFFIFCKDEPFTCGVSCKYILPVCHLSFNVVYGALFCLPCESYLFLYIVTCLCFWIQRQSYKGFPQFQTIRKCTHVFIWYLYGLILCIYISHLFGVNFAMFKKKKFLSKRISSVGVFPFLHTLSSIYCL